MIEQKMDFFLGEALTQRLVSNNGPIFQSKKFNYVKTKKLIEDFFLERSFLSEEMPSIQETFGKYTIRTISPEERSEGLGYVLGEITNCCQSVGKPGESFARYGSESPYATFILLFKREGPFQHLIGQSLVWLDKSCSRIPGIERKKEKPPIRANTFCFDSLESVFSRIAEEGKNDRAEILQLIRNISHKILSTCPHVDRVTIGAGGKTLFAVSSENIPEKLYDKIIYNSIARSFLDGWAKKSGFIFDYQAGACPPGLEEYMAESERVSPDSQHQFEIIARENISGKRFKKLQKLLALENEKRILKEQAKKVEMNRQMTLLESFIAFYHAEHDKIRISFIEQEEALQVIIKGKFVSSQRVLDNKSLLFVNKTIQSSGELTVFFRKGMLYAEKSAKRLMEAIERLAMEEG